MSPRAPRLTPAGVQQSLDIADAIDTLLVVLQKRHPNDGNLKAAKTLFATFSRELSFLPTAPNPAPTAEAGDLPTE